MKKALPIFSLVLIAFCFGLIMVASSSFLFALEKLGNGNVLIQKQCIFGLIGWIFCGIFSLLPTAFWKKLALPLFLLSVLLLALCWVPGISLKLGGAKRWIHWGPLGIQPGEFVKLFTFIYLAHYLSVKKKELSSFKVSILGPFLMLLPIFFLLFLQPDFGTLLICACVAFFLIFSAGTPLRFTFILAGSGICALGILFFSAPYRVRRFLTFLNPWKDPSGEGFQILQSFVGIHHGGFWGVGLGNGKEKLLFLPEAYNDFICSVIGEELGWMGISTTILIFLFIGYFGIQIAIQLEKINQDRFGSLLALSITLGLVFQAFFNIAVSLGLVPTKGLTLPFISYGGSALVANLCGVGILISAAKSIRTSS